MRERERETGETQLVATYSKQWQEYKTEFLKTADELPTALVIEATDRCDYSKCPACYKACEQGKGVDLQLDQIKAWMEVLQKNNNVPEQIWIAGGEPTLVPNLIEMINYLANFGSEVCLVTNGFSLSNRDYAEKIVREANLAEVAITINGANRDVHNLLMTENENPFWNEVPEDIPLRDLLNGNLLGVTPMNNFDLSLEGLINMSQLKHEYGKDFRVAINLNMNHGADLEDLVNLIESKGGRLNYAILQSLQAVGRAAPDQPQNKSFAWQKPDKEMLTAYLEQGHQLMKSGRVDNVAIIDPVGEDLEKEMNLSEEPLYQPEPSPNIGPDGNLEANVVG